MLWLKPGAPSCHVRRSFLTSGAARRLSAHVCRLRGAPAGEAAMLLSRVMRATHLSAYSASGAPASGAPAARRGVFGAGSPAGDSLEAGEVLALHDAPAIHADAEEHDRRAAQFFFSSPGRINGMSLQGVCKESQPSNSAQHFSHSRPASEGVPAPQL